MIHRFERATVRGLVGAMITAIALTTTSRADGDTAPVMAGIGGVHRTGCWTPLVIQATDGGKETIRAWVADPDGQLVGSPPVEGQDGTELPARTCVRPGRPAAQLAVERLDAKPRNGGAEGLSRLSATAYPLPGTTVASTTPLVLVHGDLPAAAAALRLVAGERTPAAAVSLTAAPIPPRLTPRDLDAFDEAIICGRDLAALPHDALTAIDGWVRGGGRLVFIAGESAQAVAAGGPPAADWLPGTEPRLTRLRRLGSLEAFARAGGLATRCPPEGVAVPLFAARRSPGGVVEVFEGVGGGAALGHPPGSWPGHDHVARPRHRCDLGGGLARV